MLDPFRYLYCFPTEKICCMNKNDVETNHINLFPQYRKIEHNFFRILYYVDGKLANGTQKLIYFE